jgi:hypothetical protein
MVAWILLKSFTFEVRMLATFGRGIDANNFNRILEIFYPGVPIK